MGPLRLNYQRVPQSDNQNLAARSTIRTVTVLRVAAVAVAVTALVVVAVYQVMDYDDNFAQRDVATNTKLGETSGLEQDILESIAVIATDSKNFLESVASSTGVAETRLASLVSSSDLSEAHLGNVANSTDLSATHLASVDTQSVSQTATLGTINTLVSDIKDMLDSPSTEANASNVRISSPLTAFGELLTASLTPSFQQSFLYDFVNPAIFTVVTSGDGNVTAENAMGILDVGSGMNDSAMVVTVDRLHYRPGLGALCRFTGIFGNGVAGSRQLMGTGTLGNGFFFGFNGADFGILHRRGGKHEHWILTVTGAIQVVGSMTVTFGGTDFSIDFTDAGAAATNAAIAFTVSEFEAASPLGDYTMYGIQYGSVHEVHIFGAFPADMIDDFTVDTPLSTFAGSFEKTKDGVVPTDAWVNQVDWNVDPMDGTGSSAQVLNPQRGNVFQVKYQWLGFGDIAFMIEDGLTGLFVVVHSIQWANANTQMSVLEPSMQLCFMLSSLGSTTPMQMKIGSMAAFVEGAVVSGKPFRAISHSQTISSAGVSENMICIRIADAMNSLPVFSYILMNVVSIAVEGSKPVSFVIIFNPTAVGAGFVSDHPIWQPIQLGVSIVEYDTNSKTVTGGQVMFAGVLAKVDSTVMDMGKASMERNNVMCIRAIPASAQAPDVSVAISWNELI